MEDSQPAKPKVIVPVEESRAQRLQRSQARFRDRGGIFVPTARNTLVDILLGKRVASPKKGRGRSASLSPKKKSAKSGLRNNDEELKAVRTSPRKAAQRQEPEAGPSNSRDTMSKHQTTKKSKTELAAPATTTSKAKAKGDSAKLAPKKRGRKPKTAVQDVAHPDTTVEHDPPPLAKSQSTPKKSRTKSPSKKFARPEESKTDSSLGSPGPKKSAQATSKTALDADTKKPSRASTSKKSTASKRKPSTPVESGSVPLQKSSRGAGSSKTKKASVPDDDQHINEVHQESSRENAGITKGKGKRKAPQTPNPGDGPKIIPVEALSKPRNKRALPAESDVEPSPPKRVKQTPLEETKSKARRRKAPATDLTQSDEKTFAAKSKDASSQTRTSKKRARESADERPGTKPKKTKHEVDVDLNSTEAADEQTNKSKEGSKGKPEKKKRLNTSKTPRAKKGTTKPLKRDKALAETKTESGALLISRVRPRKSVMVRMKDPEPHQMDNDPDPINFLG
ncbi:hypothetical protein C0992_000274 [Termitomyces sp. T32_za158]|nr:hypothetical protein C0992_000274 [Termitomyces sp. T32_za158]